MPKSSCNYCISHIPRSSFLLHVTGFSVLSAGSSKVPAWAVEELASRNQLVQKR